jgi:broad specificity phosphatase PhoE
MSGERELDLAAYDAFALALRVVLQAYDVSAPASEYEKPWQLLREIALGETTLTSVPELAARFPALRDFLYERANLMVESDRAMAQRVLRGLDEAYGSRPRSPGS